MQRLILVAAAVALLAGCAPFVKTEYDAAANFSALDSFAWQAPERDKLEDPILDSPLMDEKVQAAVISTLTARGYERTRAENADFLVTYHTVRQLEEVPGGVHTGFGFYYGPWWGYRAPFGSTIIVTNDSDTYEAGVLIIDIVNARTDELMWRGWRSKGLNQDNFSPEGVAEIVTEILAQFPPGYDPENGMPEEAVTADTV
ncbi:MAG TPA: DUF4136 domain-containing protein [Gammaproteobacteria bacterium]|nr:DUF4136 domain-containing protein [Gammaproteobacteria bacterium]